MPSNFQDVVVLNDSTLSIQGEQIVLGTAVGSKSIVFAQDPGLASAMHLVASNPTGQRTVVLRDANGTLGLLTGMSAGTTRFTNGELVFADSNGISFGINGSTLTASYTPGAGAVNFSAGVASANLGSVVFSNSNGVSFGLNGSTITASVAGGAAVNFSAGGASGNLTAVVFSNSNQVSFGLAGSTITAQHALNFSAGAASQDIGDQIVFANSNNVSFGLNGSTITAQVGDTQSYYFHWPVGQWSSSTINVSQASIQFVQLPYAISFSRLDIPMVLSMASSATANTGAMAITSAAVIYSRDGSTLNPIVGSIGNTTYTWASNTANYASVSGGRLISWGLATSLPPGDYYVYAHMSTATSSIGTATTSLNVSVSVQFGSTVTNSAFADFGQAVNATRGPNIFLGMISSRVTNTTQTLQASQVTVSGTAVRANFPLRIWNG